MSDFQEQKIGQFLVSVPLFAGLKDRQIDQVAAQVRVRKYTTDDVIVEQGKMGVGLFIIESGACEVRRSRADGTSFLVSNLGPKEFFGELSLLEEAPRTASVIATQDTVCMVLSRLDFMDALHEDAEMAIVMLKELAARFRRALANL